MTQTAIVTRAGLVSGGGAALWTLFEFAMGWHNLHLEIGAKTGFVALIFPTLATIWALSATRRLNAGRLTLKQALICGLLVSAVSAVIGVVFFYAYYTWINPAFLDLMAARGQAVDVQGQLVAVVIGSFSFGILLSAIVGLILRNRGGTAQ